MRHHGYTAAAMGPSFPKWVTPRLAAIVNRAGVNVLTYDFGFVLRFLGPKYVWDQLQ